MQPSELLRAFSAAEAIRVQQTKRQIRKPAQAAHRTDEPRLKSRIPHENSGISGRAVAMLYTSVI